MTPERQAELVAIAEARLIEADAVCHEYTVASIALDVVDPAADVARQVKALQAEALAEKEEARRDLRALKSLHLPCVRSYGGDGIACTTHGDHWPKGDAVCVTKAYTA